MANAQAFNHDLERDLGVTAVKEQLKQYCAPLTHENLGHLGPFSSMDDLISHFKRLSELDACYSRTGSFASHTACGIERLPRLCIGNFAFDIQELAGLRNNLELAAEVLRITADAGSCLNGCFAALFEGTAIVAAVNRVINNRGELRDDASTELRRIRKDLADTSTRLDSFYQHYFRNSAYDGMFREKIITVRNGRRVMLVRKEFKNRFPGVIHDESSTKESVFMEPLEALEMNNDLRSLEIAEQREIARILTEVTDIARPDASPLMCNQELLTYWEQLCGMTLYLHQCAAVIPEITEGRCILLEGALHPQIGKNGVPQNLSLDADSRMLVISGPNAGGKTVALKTIGLSAWMALSGLPVPAARAVIGWLDSILLDIGDRQSIENSLSTFSSHLVSLRDILDRAGDRSLILIDEVGSGSSPDESQALACAVLEEILHRGSLAVVTTHYRRVMEMAEQLEGMVNASLQFSLKTLEPTYRITYGEPGYSYGLAIAKRFGIPDHVLERAKNYVELDLIEYQTRLADLREKLQQTRAEGEQTKRELAAAEELRRRWELQIEDLKKTQKEKIRDLVRIKERELDDIIEGLKVQLHQVAQEKGRGEHILRSKVHEIRSVLIEEKKEPPGDPVQVSPGMEARIRGMKHWGTVLKVESGFAEIAVDSLKMRCPVSEIAQARAKTEERQSSVMFTGMLQKKLDFRRELDLRGKRMEPAIEALREFISDAVAVDEHKLGIIHGVGELILRNAVWEYLSTDAAVKRYYEAGTGDGGRGKT
ncbi:MAG: Smr/MutS family protein, partial [Candidatus Wallbacteria bacterium]|nr:Smr/MutS family protein [Candidatus Wallbacteria bacterium]